MVEELSLDGTKGAYPAAGLIQTSSGTLYLTTTDRGADSQGLEHSGRLARLRGGHQDDEVICSQASGFFIGRSRLGLTTHRWSLQKRPMRGVCEREERRRIDKRSW